MTQAGPLRWRTSAGWLLLAGGGRWELGETGEIDAAALGWALPHRPIALLLAAGGSTSDGEELLEYLADLGGPTGYIVPIYGAGDAHRLENCGLLAQAGLIYVSDGPDPLRLVRALQGSPALSAMAQALDDGASVVALGAATGALGAWTSAHEGPLRSEPGWNWVQDVIVEPRFVGTASAARLRGLLHAHPECLGLGIPKDTALALGPDGRVETVGEGQVTVVLGRLAQDEQG